VLHVKENTLVGTCAEAASRDSHKGIGRFVNVFHDFFKALQAALSNANDALNSAVITTSCFGFLSNVVDNNSNSENDSDDQRSEGKRTEVVYPSPSQTQHKFTTSSLLHVGSEVVGMRWAWVNNFGSLAFGSLIIAIIFTIRVIVYYVAKKAEAAGGDNGAVQCIICVAQCCLK
jgi:hypothetical protein